MECSESSSSGEEEGSVEDGSLSVEEGRVDSLVESMEEAREEVDEARESCPLESLGSLGVCPQEASRSKLAANAKIGLVVFMG